MTITSISQLIEELQQSSKEQYADIGVRLDIPLDEFKEYCHWNSDHYTRNCIARDDHYELILLCWEGQQQTAIHCHGGEECWVYVIDGKIEETHYLLEDDAPIEQSRDTLSAGEKSFMCDDLGYHSLRNAQHDRAISLHLYMDPIKKCTSYNVKTQQFLSRDLSYYSVDGALETANCRS